MTGSQVIKGSQCRVLKGHLADWLTRRRDGIQKIHFQNEVLVSDRPRGDHLQYLFDRKSGILTVSNYTGSELDALLQIVLAVRFHKVLPIHFQRLPKKDTKAEITLRAFGSVDFVKAETVRPLCFGSRRWDLDGRSLPAFVREGDIDGDFSDAETVVSGGSGLADATEESLAQELALIIGDHLKGLWCRSSGEVSASLEAAFGSCPPSPIPGV